MAIINCPECKKEISDSVKSCPHCGYKFNKNTWQRVWGKRLILVGILSVIGSLVYSCVTAGDRLQMRAYAFTHSNYYPPSYYFSSFMLKVFSNGGILLAFIGIILLLVYRKNK